jgi:hypothetical protein
VPVVIRTVWSRHRQHQTVRMKGGGGMLSQFGSSFGVNRVVFTPAFSRTGTARSRNWLA